MFGIFRNSNALSCRLSPENGIHALVRSRDEAIFTKLFYFLFCVIMRSDIFEFGETRSLRLAVKYVEGGIRNRGAKFIWLYYPSTNDIHFEPIETFAYRNTAG